MGTLELLKPGRLKGMMLLFIALQSAVILFRPGGTPPAWGGPGALAAVAGKVSAYAIALVLCIGIVGEYRHKGWLRFAWTCLAASAAVSLIRHLFDTQVIEALYPGYWHGQAITVMRELPSAIALLFLAAGIFSMATAFLRTGLGFTLRAVDWWAMAGICIFLGLVLYLRDDMSAASRLELWIPRQAQLASGIFFGMAAAGAIVLLRISNQMGEGKLATAMSWIIAHIATRGVLILLGPFLGALSFIPHLRLLTSLAYDCTPWMFAIAAAHRYQLTSTAAKQLSEWGAELAVSRN